MEALQKLEIHSFDAIVTDHKLPEIDSIRLLKLSVKNPPAPFIILRKRQEEIFIEALNTLLTILAVDSFQRLLLGVSECSGTKTGLKPNPGSNSYR